MTFSEKELRFLKDQEFLFTKARIISKVHELLSLTSKELKVVFKDADFSFPPKSTFKSTKISKGENYRGLPYLVLDYPAVFSNDSIFAFRTMFWWGNFFSATLHLQGKAFAFYGRNLIDRISTLSDENIYIGVGSSPWDYHYGKDNYQLLNEMEITALENKEFIKLSKKLELEHWRKLPNFSTDFLRQMLTQLI